MSKTAERLTITFPPRCTADLRAAAHLAQRSPTEHVQMIIDDALRLAAQGALGQFPTERTSVVFDGFTGSAFRELRRLIHSSESIALRTVLQEEDSLQAQQDEDQREK